MVGEFSCEGNVCGIFFLDLFITQLKIEQIERIFEVEVNLSCSSQEIYLDQRPNKSPDSNRRDSLLTRHIPSIFCRKHGFNGCACSLLCFEKSRVNNSVESYSF